MLRIYGPYLFALGLAVAGAALFQPHPGVHGVWVDQTWSKPGAAIDVELTAA